jgi:hypothetical protein
MADQTLVEDNLASSWVASCTRGSGPRDYDRQHGKTEAHNRDSFEQQQVMNSEGRVVNVMV